jgi:hypothetical protein
MLKPVKNYGVKAPRPMKSGPSQLVYDTIVELGGQATTKEILEYAPIMPGHNLSGPQIARGIYNARARGYLVSDVDQDVHSIAGIGYYNSVKQKEKAREESRLASVKDQDNHNQAKTPEKIMEPKVTNAGGNVSNLVSAICATLIFSAGLAVGLFL